MVAITGSMSDEALGYFDWKGLNHEIAAVTKEFLKEIDNLASVTGNSAKVYFGHLYAIEYVKVVQQIRNYSNNLSINQHNGNDPRVSLRVLRDLISQLGVALGDKGRNMIAEFDNEIAKLARYRHKDPRSGALLPLIEGLGINRFATLNYDYEIERALMLRRDERRKLSDSEQVWRRSKPAKPPETFEKWIGTPQEARAISRDEAGRLHRMMGDGTLVESDWVDRKRPDRLFEFAVGSSEVDRHILHLHGRADRPDSMIVDIADYDALYRHDDLNRSPFEHGMRILLGGNPVLFVGLGMTEVEINSQLQEFVSNAPFNRLAPAFVIWNTLRWAVDDYGRLEPDEKIEQLMHEKRVDFLVRLGVHIIYDRDLLDRTRNKDGTPDLSHWLSPQTDSAVGHYRDLETFHDLVQRFCNCKQRKNTYNYIIKRQTSSIVSDILRESFEKEITLEQRNIELEALRLTLDALPRAVDYLAQFSPRPWSSDRAVRTDFSERWRSIASRLSRTKKARTKTTGTGAAKASAAKADSPKRMWGTPLLATCGKSESPLDLDCLDVSWGKSNPGDNMLLAVGKPGSGRGMLAEALASEPYEDRKTAGSFLDFIRMTEFEDRLVVHSGFSYDADSTLAGIAQFLAARRRSGPARGINLAVPKKVNQVTCRQEALTARSLFQVQRNTLIILNGIDRFFSIKGEPLSAEFDILFRAIYQHEQSDFPALKWLILGTARVQRYFEVLQVPCVQLRSKRIDEYSTGSSRRVIQSKYLDWVAGKYEDREKAVSSENGGSGDPRLHRMLSHEGPTESASAKLAHAHDIDSESIRRAFYSGYLAPTYLNRLDIFCPEAFEILRTMAFIGTPIEAVVLLFAPKIRAIVHQVERNSIKGRDNGHTRYIKKYANDEIAIAKLKIFQGSSDVHEADRLRLLMTDQIRIREVLEQLLSVGIIIQMAPTQEQRYDPQTKKLGETKVGKVDLRKDLTNTEFFKLRFGLHRTLATELRERHGAPITEAKLSTSFNMSLFAAQPEERYTPEPRFHRELGELVDRLIGAWKEFKEPSASISRKVKPKLVEFLPRREINSSAEIPEEQKADFARIVINRSESEAISTMHQLSSFASAACLRAALAIVRGYYSTGNLLANQSSDLSDAKSTNGALSEHASRLDRILRNFGNVSTARHVYRSTAKARHKGEHEKLDKELRNQMGPEPFYADDLVWLHNERGVLKMVQGDNYAARQSFSLAERANQEVEPDYAGHNWRRINVNLVGLLIERGRFSRAARRLDSIEATINKPDWLAAREEQKGSRLDEIRRKFGARDERSTTTLDPTVTREELLMVGLTTGYRGLIAQMRGEFSEALERYRIATRILRRIGEIRAYGLFLRHLASMGATMFSAEERIRKINKAITAVDSVQQLDLSHRLRILRAGINPAANSRPLHDLRGALEYSVATDCFRVRIEAGAALARHMRLGGDYEAALRYACDALMIATRYGHTLQKIWLRLEVGKIMLMRGSLEAGEALLNSAERAAIRTGSQRTIEQVQRARSQMPLGGSTPFGP
jgi:tetratricopeptide (TPR) repeat protein